VRLFWFFVTVLFLVTHLTWSQSIPKGKDSTAQVFPAKSYATDLAKPANLTSIQSRKDVETLLASFNFQPSESNCKPGVAIVLHTAEWLVTTPTKSSQDNAYSLVSSQWTGYTAHYDTQSKDNKCRLRQRLRVDKNPLFYGATGIYLIAINYFADSDGNGIQDNQFQLSYKVSTTPSTQQNIQDLATLVAGVVGFALPSISSHQAGPQDAKQLIITPPPTFHYFTLRQSILPTSQNPFSLNISPLLQPGTNSLPAATADQTYYFDVSGLAGKDTAISDVENLPADLSFDKTKHVITGTPTSTSIGTQQIMLTTSNSTTNSTNRLAMSMTVQPAKSDGAGTNQGAPTDNSSPKQPKGQGNQSSTTSPSQPVDCSNITTSNPCTFTRNFPADDKEYWDVSLGLAIPGPKENVFKASTNGGIPSSSPTTHTDAYALADIYLLASKWPKVSYAPHINAGIPITSQSLHRPYVGLGEDVSPTLQQHGFPLDLCIFGGIVFMKQQFYDPNVTTKLRTDWAHKAMFGVEVPISSITSKLSSKSKSNSSKSGSGGN
jgi:hypothetical protein